MENPLQLKVLLWLKWSKRNSNCSKTHFVLIHVSTSKEVTINQSKISSQSEFFYMSLLRVLCKCALINIEIISKLSVSTHRSVLSLFPKWIPRMMNHYEKAFSNVFSSCPVLLNFFSFAHIFNSIMW